LASTGLAADFGFSRKYCDGQSTLMASEEKERLMFLVFGAAHQDKGPPSWTKRCIKSEPSMARETLSGFVEGRIRVFEFLGTLFDVTDRAISPNELISIGMGSLT
jgi:hypothetical protein